MCFCYRFHVCRVRNSIFGHPVTKRIPLPVFTKCLITNVVHFHLCGVVRQNTGSFANQSGNRFRIWAICFTHIVRMPIFFLFLSYFILPHSKWLVHKVDVGNKWRWFNVPMDFFWSEQFLDIRRWNISWLVWTGSFTNNTPHGIIWDIIFTTFVKRYSHFLFIYVAFMVATVRQPWPRFVLTSPQKPVEYWIHPSSKHDTVPKRQKYRNYERTNRAK